jgi:hypothetical protein
MNVPKEASKFILDSINGLRKTMFLTHFKIDVEYANIGADMVCEVDYRYLDARITIDRKTILDYWSHGERKEILYLLVHELSHLISGEMSDPFQWKGKTPKKQTELEKHFEERVTEHISRIALKAYLLEVNK